MSGFLLKSCTSLSFDESVSNTGVSIIIAPILIWTFENEQPLTYPKRLLSRYLSLSVLMYVKLCEFLDTYSCI